MLKTSFYVSIILYLLSVVASYFLAGPAFGRDTAIFGMISIAIMGSAVLLFSRIFERAKEMNKDEETEDAAQFMVTRVLIISLLKLTFLALSFIALVVFLRLDARAGLIGVTVIYLPLLIVPLFLNPASKKTDNVNDGAEPNVESKMSSD